MSLVRFGSRNHPQQTAKRAPEMFPEPGRGVEITDDVDDRGTDPALFAELHRRFHFTLDVAASEGNAKTKRFFTRDNDGLAQSWSGERVWCNPPYSNIAPWVAKALASDAPLIVMLLPANRTEQAWWQNHVEPFRDKPGSRLTTEFLLGRRRFIMPGNDRIKPNERPPFGCVLLIWNG